MSTSDIFYMTASVAMVIIVVLLIPALNQIKRTTRKAEETLDAINRELEPLLAKATETSSELQILTLSLNDKIERTDNIIETLQQTGNTLLSTAILVKKTINPLVAQVGGISAGVAAFTSFFKKNETPLDRRYFDE
ncbi:MAG: hypothetical protein BM485_06930 [Desulfobulbaceae bacterium DB1]|nr:MAG: hypothetical protein BM485_06930 [Desulfobulbaceae bacterium DB1]